MKKPKKLLPVTLLASLAMAAPALHGSISILTSDFTYSQDFDSLPTANTGTFVWTDNETLPGWYRRSNISNADQTPNPNLVDRSAQGSNVGVVGFYNASIANNTDRAVGFRINGQAVNDGGLKKGSVGVVFTNNTGTIITGFDLGYTGEKWYQAVNDTTLLVQYAVVDSFATDINGDIDRAQPGTWTDVGALSWTVLGLPGTNSWTNGTQAGNFNVFEPVTLTGLSIADGQQLVIRWRIAEAGAQRSGLFIDDVTFGNLTVIPEPRTVAVWAALTMLGLVIYRRKRA